MPRSSAELAARAANILPGGASHDGRQLEPHGIFVRSGSGAYKADEEGRSYIDLQCGNGALLLGHGHPDVLNATSEALAAGVNFSATSVMEIRWAETIRRLMPAAEQIVFTASGNEAVALAFAVARTVTGRNAILVPKGHYYGWIAPALLQCLPIREILSASKQTEKTVIGEAESLDEIIDALATQRFAAVIMEPTGAGFGKIPMREADLRAITDAAVDAGSLSIFDETITGFRFAPGGAQGAYGIAPDLTILGKILGGGLPCGALAGRRSHLDSLDNRPRDNADRPSVSHMGTGNGNPVAAAAGLATLELVADGRAIDSANAAAARLRDGLNRIFCSREIAWAAYGEDSDLHIFLNPQGQPIDQFGFDAALTSPDDLLMRNPELINALRIRLLENGIDANPWPGGLLSSVHDDAIVDEAIAAFDAALAELKKQGVRLTGWGQA
ncbi:aminotransferase class III-fold pyridoxal phosphate-dependent enzyme [Parasphingopyxis sp.]|uniref:aminotransferase class III-fold pyridoxal phosphate-dependent enzyme n=1 Tax=Parasphingopyxis sp. TaxID=1920299 RepID=UPI00261DF13A|nr:aminotransferase class III-fold pyridoxal phosphate-dependent enzyme [Parasphingopyxis sp.]